MNKSAMNRLWGNKLSKFVYQASSPTSTQSVPYHLQHEGPTPIRIKSSKSKLKSSSSSNAISFSESNTTYYLHKSFYYLNFLKNHN